MANLQLVLKYLIISAVCGTERKTTHMTQCQEKHHLKIVDGVGAVVFIDFPHVHFLYIKHRNDKFHIASGQKNNFPHDLST